MISPTDLKFCRWYNDSGHGWLGVPVRVLLESGVASEISSCSYINGTMTVAYLEEDCDAPKFLDAIGFRRDEEGLSVSETKYDGDCFIRRLPSYDAAALVGPTSWRKEAKK